MARWIGARAYLTWARELGEWQITGRDENGWLEIVSISAPGKGLSSMGSDGRLWVQQRDMTRLPDQAEGLF